MTLSEANELEKQRATPLWLQLLVTCGLLFGVAVALALVVGWIAPRGLDSVGVRGQVLPLAAMIPDAQEFRVSGEPLAVIVDVRLGAPASPEQIERLEEIGASEPAAIEGSSLWVVCVFDDEDNPVAVWGAGRHCSSDDRFTKNPWIPAEEFYAAHSD